MYQRTTFDFRSFFHQARCPVTVGLLLANVATFLMWFFTRLNFAGALGFSSSAVAARPWSLLTYPVVSYGIYDVVLGGYMLWLFGGSLERAWGSRRFAWFFGAVTGITSGSLWIGSLLLHAPAFLAGLWLPLSALVVAWCLMNLTAVVLLFFVLPVQARVLAWLDVALTYFGYGSAYGPWLAFFALAGCGFAYLYLRGLPRGVLFRTRPSSPPRRPLQPDAPVRPLRSWNPLAILERWQRKRRFQRLWKDSGMEEMFRDSDSDKPH